MPKWKLASGSMSPPASLGEDFSCNYSESSLVMVFDSKVFCKCLVQKHANV